MLDITVELVKVLVLFAQLEQAKVHLVRLLAHLV
jgi:hypothetical protein